MAEKDNNYHKFQYGKVNKSRIYFLIDRCVFEIYYILIV